MKLKNYIIFFKIYIMCILMSTLNTPAYAANESHSLAPMLKKILPAIVNIRADVKITDPIILNRLQQKRKTENNPSPIPKKALSIGSGVIVNAKQGYILTNAHVVQNADNVMVTLSDSHHYRAKIIGLDRPSDIALLQIHGKNLSEIIIADSNKVKIGDSVVAIGNPFGLNQSVTSGIVSAIGRNTLGIEAYENFIQIDASINPGNSGGALVNTEGKLLGINTAIIAPNQGSVGIGFAIPSKLAVSVMKQLIEYGNVKRGALGIGAQDVNPYLETAFGLKNVKGAVITLITPNSPAQDAKLQVGDIIIKIDDTKITTANDVVNAIGLLRVNSEAKLTILRNNKKQTISATLKDPKEREHDNQVADPFFYGVALQHFSLLSPNHGKINGVLIVSVKEDTNAWRSDLRAGDVIIAAGGEKITSISKLKKIAAKSKTDSLLLNVLRGPGAIFLVISKET